MAFTGRLGLDSSHAAFVSIGIIEGLIEFHGQETQNKNKIKNKSVLETIRVTVGRKNLYYKLFKKK